MPDFWWLRFPGEKLTWDDVNVRGQNLFLLGE